MILMSVLVTILIVLAVSYGGYVFWTWFFKNNDNPFAKNKGITKINPVLSALAVGVFMMATTGGAFAQSTPTITFDLSPFFDSLNSYLPIFIGLFGIVGGIAGAMALARYVIGAVVRAFSGGSI